jgi:hypothetical protein
MPCTCYTTKLWQVSMPKACLPIRSKRYLRVPLNPMNVGLYVCSTDQHVGVRKRGNLWQISPPRKLCKQALSLILKSLVPARVAQGEMEWIQNENAACQWPYLPLRLLVCKPRQVSRSYMGFDRKLSQHEGLICKLLRVTRQHNEGPVRASNTSTIGVSP